MSTCYYLYCDKCKSHILVARWSLGGFGWENNENIPEFISKHEIHGIRFISEQELDRLIDRIK